MSAYDADVLIAGAGPAGSLAGLILARAGVRVRLVDRARFPRDKLCGDTVNPGALAILDRLRVGHAARDGALAIAGMLVTSRGAAVAGSYGPGISGTSLRRRDLDLRLLEAAAGAGVQFECETRVDDAARDTSAGGRVCGLRVTDARGTSRTLRAPLTIAADGRRSRLAFALGLAVQPARPRRWAIGAYFEGVAHPDRQLGEMHLGRGRYVGIAPVPGGLTNVCLVVEDPAPGALADPAALLRAALEGDRRLWPRLAGARRVGPPVVLGPLAVDTTAAGVPGLLLAGDAAGFIDPITGDGLRFAFRGAELAAAVALDALAGRIAHPEFVLTRRRAHEFGRKWRLNRALRRLVGSPGLVACAAQGARVWPGFVRRLVASAGDVPTSQWLNHANT